MKLFLIVSLADKLDLAEFAIRYWIQVRFPFGFSKKKLIGGLRCNDGLIQF